MWQKKSICIKRNSQEFFINAIHENKEMISGCKGQWVLLLHKKRERKVFVVKECND